MELLKRTLSICEYEKLELVRFEALNCTLLRTVLKKFALIKEQLDRFEFVNFEYTNS
jgi:hypothetical protein